MRSLTHIKNLVRIGVLLIAVAVPGSSHAAASEHIGYFHSDIHVDHQGMLHVTETIQYDFGASAHHGIYRIVPTSYTDETGKYYATTAQLDQITQDGATVNVSESSNDNGVSWKVGDANRTLTGEHLYKIMYEFGPALTQKSDGDFLNLNITGNGWDVPIENASVGMSFDDNPTLSQGKCFAGTKGSTSESGCSLVVNSSGLAASAPSLPAGSGLTINVKAPVGYTDHYLASSAAPDNSLSRGAWIFIGLVLIVPLLIFVGILYVIWVFVAVGWRERRRKKAQVIVAQYEAPKDWLPAEIGLLDENVADMREITATLIDLAVRGYIKIEQTDKGNVFKGAKYRITQLKEYADAADYERTLLEALLEHKKSGVLDVAGALLGKKDESPEASNGMRSIMIDEVDRTYMSKAVASIRKTLQERLVSRGVYPDKKTIRGLIKRQANAHRLTDTGIQQWAQIEGLKLYLNVVEKDRLKFSDAPDKTPERFNKLLPYAIALNVEEQWAKQFEGIDIASDTGWYSSPYGTYTALALTQSLNSSFATSVNSSFAPPSSSSSMSSGGGMSGGGVGGGGGGSW